MLSQCHYPRGPAPAGTPVLWRCEAKRYSYCIDPDADRYGVTVGPASAALTGRAATEASSPLPPISEPMARAMAEDALNTEAHSPNASIRSTAQLVEGLAGIVLGATDPNGAPAS